METQFTAVPFLRKSIFIGPFMSHKTVKYGLLNWVLCLELFLSWRECVSTSWNVFSTLAYYGNSMFSPFAMIFFLWLKYASPYISYILLQISHVSNFSTKKSWMIELCSSLQQSDLLRFWKASKKKKKKKKKKKLYGDQNNSNYLYFQ